MWLFSSVHAHAPGSETMPVEHAANNVGTVTAEEMVPAMYEYGLSVLQAFKEAQGRKGSVNGTHVV